MFLISEEQGKNTVPAKEYLFNVDIFTHKPITLNSSEEDKALALMEFHVTCQHYWYQA